MFDQDAFLSSFSTSSTLPLLSIFPAQDTIRGGLLLIIATDGQLLDTSSDQTFLAESLPAAWSSVASGSGITTPTLLGVETHVGPTATGVSGATTSSTNFDNFDATLDVELLSAAPQNVVDQADVAVFEHRVDASTRFYVSLSVLPNLPGVWVQSRIIQSTAFEPIVAGTTAFVEDTDGVFTLRLVRNGPRVFAFFGRRSELTGEFTELTSLLSYASFTTDPGDFRFQVGNASNAVGIRSRFSNFEIRSHFLIDGKLVDNKVDISDRRISGNVPATILERRGLRDICLFGLFGEVNGPNGFEYILPPPLTAGRRAGQDFLRTYVDVQLRDGDD